MQCADNYNILKMTSITNMLNKIDEISKDLKDEDYKYLLEELKKVKEKNEELENNNVEMFCCSITIKYNILSLDDNCLSFLSLSNDSVDNNKMLAIGFQNRFSTIKIKLSKKEIKIISKLLNININNHYLLYHSDDLDDDEKQLLIIIVNNIKESLDKCYKTNMYICDDCNDECECADLENIKTIKCYCNDDNMQIYISSIDIYTDDWKVRGSYGNFVENKYREISSNLYNKYYYDTKPFGKYVDDILKNIKSMYHQE